VAVLCPLVFAKRTQRDACAYKLRWLDSYNRVLFAEMPLYISAPALLCCARYAVSMLHGSLESGQDGIMEWRKPRSAYRLPIDVILDNAAMRRPSAAPLITFNCTSVALTDGVIINLFRGPAYPHWRRTRSSDCFLFPKIGNQPSSKEGGQFLQFCSVQFYSLASLSNAQEESNKSYSYVKSYITWSNNKSQT